MNEEWKRKIGLAHLGKKRKPFSIKWRKNLSRARMGIKFTKEHCHNISLAQRMEKGNNWAGGKIKHEGYVLIKTSNHPSAQKNNYVFEHRLVMEKHLGRYLTSEEVVHHINGILDDNRIENLKLFKNHATHIKHHNL